MQPIRYVYSSDSVMPTGELISMAEVDRGGILSAPSAPQVHILMDGQTINWKPRLVEDLCVGPHPAISHTGEYNSGRYYVASVAEALVDLRMGFFMLEGGAVWCDSATFTIMHGPTHLSPAIICEGEQRFIDLERAAPRRLEITGPAMMICHWASLVNYGHWMMNSLLPVVLMLDEIKAKKITLVLPVLPPRWREDLLLVGVPESQILEVEDQYVIVPHLLYPSTVSTASNNFPAQIGMKVFEAVKNAIAIPEDAIRPTNLYVTRMGAVNTRVMTNETSLISELERIGFTTIYPHEMTLAEQIAAFSNADVIIGQYGAALWNIPFAPRGGTLIEIANPNYGSAEYASVANLMDRQVVLIASEPTSMAHSADFEFEVPIEAVLRAARSVMSRSKKGDA